MPNLSPATATITTAQTIELTTTIANAIWSIVSGAGSLGTGSTAYKKILTPSGPGTVDVQAVAPFYAVMASGFTNNGDGSFTTGSSGYDSTTKTSHKLTAVGDKIRFTYKTGRGGWVVNGLNIGYLLLGVNGDIYSTTGGYGANPGTNVGASGASNNNVLEWEIISGNFLQLYNVTTSSIIFTSGTALTLTGGNYVEMRYYQYGEASTLIDAPTISGSGVTGFSTETATITVVQVLDITTTSPLPAGTKYSAYSQAIATAGGTSPRTVSLHTGNLPGGLSLASNTISGTCTAQGTFTFTLRVTDNVGATYDKAFSLTVNLPAAPTISTTSPLLNGIIDVAYSLQLAKTGQTGTWSKISGTFPAGISMNSSGLISGTPTVVGTSTNIVIRFTDLDGQSDEETYSLTVMDAIPVPTSIWSRKGIVPLTDCLFWNALDVAEDATEIGDFSGNDNKLEVASSAPVLQTNIINGNPAVYFDGTKNPLKFTNSINLKHIFLIAKFDGAEFDGNEGLLSGVAATSILRGNGDTTTKFANLSIGSGYIYRKNFVTLTESTQNAPMNGFSIIELVFPSGISLDGIQIGQDTTNTGRKWKGWFVEQIGYGEVQDENCRRDIYEYFAIKFYLWKKKTFGAIELNILPFAPDRGSDMTEGWLAEMSEAEGQRGQDKVTRYLDDTELKSWSLQFGTRHSTETNALRTFLAEHKLHLPYWFIDAELNIESRVVTIGTKSVKGKSYYIQDLDLSIKEY